MGLRSRCARALSLAGLNAQGPCDRLNNPRGLSFGPDGALYIAEAGVAAGTGPRPLSEVSLSPTRSRCEYPPIGLTPVTVHLDACPGRCSIREADERHHTIRLVLLARSDYLLLLRAK